MKRTIRPLIGAAFLYLGASYLCCAQGGGAEKKQEPGVILSTGPNLFVDDYLIAASWNLKRTMHHPERHPDSIFAVPSGNVFYDSESKLFRMRYNDQGQYALAESKDGINWNKPELGLIELNGNKKNNLIEAPRGGFQGQFIDDGPGGSDPARRYKLAFFRGGVGLGVAFSPDGLRFTEFPGNPVIPANANKIPFNQPGYVNQISDVINGCWDPLRKEYLLVCKVELNGFPGKPHHHAAGWRRCVGMSTSKDFVNWDIPAIIIKPDPKNGLEEFYSFAPFVRGNLYLGFLRVLRDDLPATAGGPVEGIGWTELVTSRDGRNWTRHQEPFLDRDPREGRFDHAMVWCDDSVTLGDQEFIYYGAHLSGHKTDRVTGRKEGVAILRKNGFVSRDAGPEGGTLKTPPAVLPGKHLTVNAVIRGEMKARLLDADGKVLPGFDESDCVALHGDSVAQQVKWQGNPALPKGKVVSLEFTLKDAEFYGFDFSD